MKTVIVVGYSAWDLIFPLAETPPPDSKTEVSPMVTCGGGPAANAAIALSKLGARVRLVSVMSDDAFGRAHLTELETAGVDVSLIRTAAHSRSPLAVIRVDPRSGERRIYWERGDLPRYDPAGVDASWLAGADLLLCDSHEAPAAAVLAFAARRRGLPVVLDAGSVKAGVPELVAHCTDVIGATGFACALNGIADQREALRRLRGQGPLRVGTTFGRAGVLGLDGDGFRYVPAFVTQVVDTTGAGDAFHAGYAWSLAAGGGFAASLRCGAAVAALQCRAYGGRAGLPCATEVETLLAHGSYRDDAPPILPPRRG
ncbi:hypothetical protein KKG45_00415 [bacterium]|nr:hypothetical protein [bacterium]MBU1071687.1 hypothetical protein [bacterium]